MILDQPLDLNKQEGDILLEELCINNDNSLYMNFLIDQKNQQNLFEHSYKDIYDTNLKKKLFKVLENDTIQIKIKTNDVFYKVFDNDKNSWQRKPPLINIQKHNLNILNVKQIEYSQNFLEKIDDIDKEYINNIKKFENSLFEFTENILQRQANFNILLLIKRGDDFQKFFKLYSKIQQRNIIWKEILNQDSSTLEKFLQILTKNSIVVFTQIQQLLTQHQSQNINQNNLQSFLKFLKQISLQKQICFIFATDSDDYESIQYEFDVVQNLRQFDNNNLQNFKEKFLDKSQLNYQDLKSIQYLFIENDISKIIDTIKPLEFLYQQEKIENQKFLKIVKKKLNSSNKFETEVPKLSWDNIGGVENVKQELISSFKYDDNNDIKKQKGILLFGPPGTGKTLLAKCIANEFNSSFIAVKGPELLDKYIGESEKNLRQVFAKANRCIPCVLFFDELDSLLPKRGNSQDSSQVTDRMVSQFLAELENSDPNLFLIAATNRPDLLDAAILSSGKFDKKIFMGIMNDKEQRIRVIQSQTKDINLHKNCTLEQIEQICPNNITGADFYGITMNAVQLRISKKKQQMIQQAAQKNMEVQKYIKTCPEQQYKLILEIEDFKESLINFTPSISTEEIKNYDKLRLQYADLEIK